MLNRAGDRCKTVQTEWGRKIAIGKFFEWGKIISDIINRFQCNSYLMQTLCFENFQMFLGKQRMYSLAEEMKVEMLNFF